MNLVTIILESVLQINNFNVLISKIFKSAWTRIFQIHYYGSIILSTQNKMAQK